MLTANQIKKVARLERQLAELKGKIPSKKPGSDWYYYTVRAETCRYRNGKLTAPKVVNFCFVHRRYWHYNHSILDMHLNLPGISDFFSQVQESVFEYDGSPAKAHAELKALGYVRLDKRQMWQSAMVTDFTDVWNGTRVTVYCDTPWIKKEFEKAMQTRWPKAYFDGSITNWKDVQQKPALMPFNNLAAYKRWAEKWASQWDWKFVTYNEYEGGCSAAVMTSRMYESLPKIPKGHPL